MKANGNFSDARLEWCDSASINRVMRLKNDHKNNIIDPCDAVDLSRPCNSLFAFQVFH